MKEEIKTLADEVRELERFAGDLGLDARIRRFQSDFVLVGLYGYPLAHMPCLGTTLEAAKESLRVRAEKDRRFINKQEMK